MKQTSPISYSRAWSRERIPTWRAGRSLQAKGSVRLVAKPPETYGKGRICAEDDCDTVLSRYNPDDVCGTHDAAA